MKEMVPIDPPEQHGLTAFCRFLVAPDLIFGQVCWDHLVWCNDHYAILIIWQKALHHPLWFLWRYPSCVTILSFNHDILWFIVTGIPNDGLCFNHGSHIFSQALLCCWWNDPLVLGPRIKGGWLNQGLHHVFTLTPAFQISSDGALHLFGKLNVSLGDLAHLQGFVTERQKNASNRNALCAHRHNHFIEVLHVTDELLCLLHFIVFEVPVSVMMLWQTVIHECSVKGYSLF